MTTVSLRFDDKTKRELDEMCEAMGMNLTTFFTIYAKRALRERRIPFEVNAYTDPFYSAENLHAISEADKQISDGRRITVTMEQLEAMAADE